MRTDDGHDSTSLNPEAARRRMEEQFRANAERPLFTGTAVRPSHDRKPFVSYMLKFGPQLPPPEVLPHVYSSSSMAQGNILSHLGTKYMLPIDTKRLMREVGPLFPFGWTNCAYQP